MEGIIFKCPWGNLLKIASTSPFKTFKEKSRSLNLKVFPRDICEIVSISPKQESVSCCYA